ncbi:MAG: DUF2993 domain-containing protein [Gloeocapsa sp. DLM2.Bin57]|nr:MAG: DUF2993 domain-containing protein [Gloeocapsa sp. DLM2.Bin57]
MFASFQGLGENTLSKIAEVALSNQLKADKLKVTVKTNPENLAKGIVESLSIDSEGLIMSNNQSLQNLRMTFEQITVNPLQALIGKIKLTQPSQGTAFFVLSRKDLEQHLNRVKPDSLKSINCYIAPDGDLIVKLISSKQELNFQLRPRLCQVSHRVLVEEVTQNNVPELVLKEIEALFNLGHFYLKGLSLKIQSLVVNNGHYSLKAVTEITHFPQVV